MRLESRDGGQTDLVVHSEASIFGKLGQFGQAILLKKVDQLIGEWITCLSRKLSAAQVDSGVTLDGTPVHNVGPHGYEPDREPDA